MVSHDRRFLDNITNRTIEIVFGKIYDYKAPYSEYLIQRQERYDTQIATFKNQQKHIEQQERFITRFKAKASKSKQVQSKIKMLEKIDRIEMDEFDESSINFRFPAAPRSGAVVIEANDVDKHYDDKHVLKNLNFKIQRGDRIAFVGKNGMGKTTLVKLITGEEKCTGELILGHNVAQGYYAQVQEKTLRKDATVLETLEHEATGDWTKTNKLRGLLGAFLFRDSDIDKKVKVLSGGEKSRLALARLLLFENNLIILDEPTNHLDMRAKDVLKQALQNFDGTLIVVSHDRDFLSELTTKTFEFTPTGTKEHLGDISEFLDKYKYEHFRELEQTSKTEKKSSEKKASNPSSEANEKLSYEDKKAKEKEDRQLRSDLNKTEKKIEKLELELAEMENKMSDPTFYDGENEASKKLFFEHAEIQKKLDLNMQEWETLSEKIES
ncbi:ATP-binding cassette domain-containing protein [Salibacteraceae bacterium]|nr:ATP-binding cassette domain-containing protein [Salibacteraceae bacterium]